MIKHVSEVLSRQGKSKLNIVMQTSEVDPLQFSVSSRFSIPYSFFSLFFSFFPSSSLSTGVHFLGNCSESICRRTCVPEIPTR